MSCSVPVKCLLFKSYCYSMYLSSLWLKYPAYEFNHVRVAYNNAIRKLFRLPFDSSISGFTSTVGLRTFENNFDLARKRLRERLLKCRNKLIVSVLSSDVYMTSKYWVKFRECAFVNDR